MKVGVGEVCDEGMFWEVARKWPVSFRHPEDDDMFRGLMVFEGSGIVARFKGLGSWLNGAM
jgi:hypothetical protein